MKPLSLADAIASGSKRYFTGEPCKNGHIEERIVSSRQCMSCCRERMAKAYHKDLGLHRKRSADYRSRNPEASKASARSYDKANRELRKLAAAQRRSSDPSKARQAVDKYRAKNIERIRLRKNEIERARKMADPIYRTEKNIRRSLAYRLQKYGYKKLASSMEILGCSWGEFVSHIESLFKPGMSWDNRSDWHVDHITPLASAKTYEEMISLWHYTNLQPLWAVENLQKGGRVVEQTCN